MKSRKSGIKTKLTKRQVKNGIFVARSLRLDEIPLRKVGAETLREVQFGRRGFVVTDFGKPYAALLPLWQED